MMMPANFSAISENEMTYVAGGSLADILAPALTTENWQKFNTNMVTIIGNSFVTKYVNNTVGVLFGGEYKPGALGQAWWTNTTNAFSKGKDAGWTGSDYSTTGKKFLAVNNGLLNVALNAVGSAAAIYNLATGTVKNAVSENVLKIDSEI